MLVINRTWKNTTAFMFKCQGSFKKESFIGSLETRISPSQRLKRGPFYFYKKYQKVIYKIKNIHILHRKSARIFTR